MDLFNKKKINKLQKELNHKDNLIEMQDRITKSLEDELSSRRLENEKLIDWIMNILKELGTIDAGNNSNFVIPVNRKIESVYSVVEGMGTMETIHIPAITISKMKR